mmetsp:Transcript_21640/g.38411  ORF Transcript_21640/g.38411 Transcript_21640/m.38411 type:complete len:247 (+) Transcript_21640:32-772(+)
MGENKKAMGLLSFSHSNLGLNTFVPQLSKFIYKKKKNSYYKINLNFTFRRIVHALSILFTTKCFRDSILVDTKESNSIASKKYCELTGSTGFFDDYVPGNFSNRKLKTFFQPSVAIVSEPLYDIRVVQELCKRRAPIIGICNTNSNCSFVDVVIPLNTSSKFSNSVFYFVLFKSIKKFDKFQALKYKANLKKFLLLENKTEEDEGSKKIKRVPGKKFLYTLKNYRKRFFIKKLTGRFKARFKSKRY